MLPPLCSTRVDGIQFVADHRQGEPVEQTQSPSSGRRSDMRPRAQHVHHRCSGTSKASARLPDVLSLVSIRRALRFAFDATQCHAISYRSAHAENKNSPDFPGYFFD
jgi:hypothetical protein